MPKRDALLYGGSAGRIDVTFLESTLKSALDPPAPSSDELDEVELVAHWREACRALMDYLTEQHSELTLPPSLRAALEHALPGALTSPWVATYGLGQGLALRMVAVLRQELAPQVPPLVPPPRSLALVEQMWRDVDDWGPRLARVEAALQAPPPSGPERIRQAFGVSEAELARMFGVSRQAVAQWHEFPVGKRAKAATVLAIADLLTYRLKPGRLALVARNPADAYEGVSMLDLIAADRHDELLRLTRKSFELAATA